MMRRGGTQVAGENEEPALEGGQAEASEQKVAGDPESVGSLEEAAVVEPPPEVMPATDEPSVVGVEFEKVAAAANVAARPDLPPQKPDESDDEWYVRTGQPAPDRDKDGDNSDDADGQTDSATMRYGAVAVGAIVLIVALIILFGVFMS